MAGTGVGKAILHFHFIWSLLMHEHDILFTFYSSAGQERQFAHTHLLRSHGVLDVMCFDYDDEFTLFKYCFGF